MHADHSQILSHNHEVNSVLHSCMIKSGSGLGTKLATNYAPDEEVMKTLSHCLETILHTKHTNTEES